MAQLEAFSNVNRFYLSDKTAAEIEQEFKKINNSLSNTHSHGNNYLKNQKILLLNIVKEKDFLKMSRVQLESYLESLHCFLDFFVGSSADVEGEEFKSTLKKLQTRVKKVKLLLNKKDES